MYARMLSDTLACLLLLLLLLLLLPGNECSLGSHPGTWILLKHQKAHQPRFPLIAPLAPSMAPRVTMATSNTPNNCPHEPSAVE